MEDQSMRKIMTTINSWLQKKVRWITRPLILATFVLVLLNVSRPAIMQWLGSFFGFAQPSLATMIAVMILLFILERVLLLEERLGRSPVMVYETRVSAYHALHSIIQTRRIANIDIIQFSGFTAGDFLEHLLRLYPTITIRMLLASDEVAKTYNSDDFDHTTRIKASIQRLKNYERYGARVNIRRYTTPASISSLIIDNHIVLLGWYRIYYERGNIWYADMTHRP